MCLSEAIVIVIVRSRNGEGSRFKYINVRKESRMVARLPQQVFLLLVLVTGTTSGTVHRAKQSSWTTGSSTRRIGPPAETLSHSTTPKADAGRTYSHGRNILSGFEETLLEAGITIDAEVPISMNLYSSPVFSISDAKPSTHERKNIRSSRHEFEEDLDTKGIRLQDPKDGINNNDENRQLESKLTSEQSWFHSDEEMYIFSSPFIVSSPVEGVEPFDREAAFKSAPMPLLSSSWVTLERIGSIDNLMAADSLHTKIDVASATSDSTKMSNTGDTLLQGRGKTAEDASSEIRGNRKALVQSLVDEASQADDHKVLINDSSNHQDEPPQTDAQNIVSESLDHEDMLEPSKKIDDQSVRHTLSSLEFLAAKSIVDKLQQPEKSKTSEEVRKIAGSSKVTHPILTEKEKAPYLDVPPPNFLSTTSMDQPTKDNAEKIDPSSDQYRKRNFDWLTSERIPSQVTSRLITAVGFPKRYARDAETDQCEKFIIEDSSKREFYSPNYPQNYPPNINCIRTLEAEKGMLLKLDFRERFELESMTPLNDKVGECRFDYLEVRDGQYGFSNLLGVFCDKQFPPEIISKSRHLWLRFHSDDTIEYRGFKAVWSTIPRPTTGGVPPEQEPCFRNITNNSDVIVTMDDVREEKKNAERYKVSLDCLWVITAPADSRLQLTFDPFKLEKPNDCSANFLEVFDQRTDIPSRLKNFCGSMAETVHTTKNVVFIRFYVEPKAINGTFKSLITVVRDKGSTDKPCRDNEYDCDDNTCIALSLKCNDRYNCRFLRDEDASMCGTTAEHFDSSRVIIILVIFSLIMFGMCFAFVFNCVRKLIRDHRIIKEHIRQSRENRLDEIGRKTTPCPASLSRTDLREHRSESPSVEIESSKELIPSTLLCHEYTKELVLEMKYGAKDANDIHQSNNVSNATQERLQESTEELEMCDSSCQTRESLFEPSIPVATLPSPPFSTFGYRRDSEAQTGVSPQRKTAPQQSDKHRHNYRHQHHHQQHPHHPSPGQCSQQSHQSCPSNSPPSGHPVSEQCSVCPSSTSRESSLVICPKHNPIPAPPGWSVHDPPYPHVEPIDSRATDNPGCTTYERYRSPKPDGNPMAARHHRHQHRHQTPVYTRQNTAGSGERYDSLIYGSARVSSNATSNGTSPSNPTTGSGSQHAPVLKYAQSDPRYRAEAIIEVDQKRPFSIESTKSAPDVIATH